MSVIPLSATVLLMLNASLLVPAEASYEEWLSASDAQSRSPEVVKWGKEELIPLFASNQEKLLLACASSLHDSQPTSARLIVRLSAEGIATAFDHQGSVSLSNCLVSELKAWKWPTPPAQPLYFPFNFTFTPKVNAKSKSADDVIIDLLPSNTSLERTR